MDQNGEATRTGASTIPLILELSTALDEIITRLMEQDQGSRPVPAPDDMIAKLPRTKVTAGSTFRFPRIHEIN